MKLSVIIPVYNVENYLGRCLESIINQKYENNLEVILVNDGSTDNSQDIIEYYSSKYSFIRAFEKENGGLSDARNYGLKKSLGDYVWFIDSDDWISKDAFEIIFNEIEANKLDILEFDFYKAREVGNKIILSKNSFYNSIETTTIKGSDMLESFGYIVGVCYKVIKKDIFLKNDLWFPLKKLNEDHVISYQLMKFCVNYKKVSCPLYYYFSRAESITENLSLNHKYKYIQDQLDNIFIINDLIENEQIIKTKEKEVLSFYLTNIILQILSLKDRNYLLEVLDKVKSKGLYPIQKYDYHNSSYKRKFFIKLINKRVLLCYYNRLLIRK